MKLYKIYAAVPNLHVNSFHAALICKNVHLISTKLPSSKVG